MGVSSVGGAGGNWIQDVASAQTDGADWMDPNSTTGPDAFSAAANAIAAAHQIQTTTQNSIAVNTGIQLLQNQLNGNSANSVNKLV